MSRPLLPANLDQELKNINSLRYWYAIARALHRGQKRKPHRQSLPSELVLYIFRLCDLPRCHPSPVLGLHWLEKTTLGDRTLAGSTWGLEGQDRLWCATPPLSKQFLEQINKPRLRARSKSRGWGDQIWFEIGILKRLAASKVPPPPSAEIEQAELGIRSDAWGPGHHDLGEEVEAQLNPLTGRPCDGACSWM
ncbi:hypothetical protein FRB95_005708 [Tulasnella sp. JGI-2019a]|nr:hypothetical protein FRB95_005708 [Tulasnella sp. JGI-2019a]